MLVIHSFNTSTWEAETGESPQFELRLVYIVSSSTAKTTQRNPVLGKEKETAVLERTKSIWA